MPPPSFDDVPHWEDWLDLTRNIVRQHLITQQLTEHLPPVSQRLTVVDIGCGQGTQVLEFARRGYRVTGIDPSEKLLERAREDRAKQSTQIRDRVTFIRGDLASLKDLITDPIDVLLCHGVLMYLPDLEISLQTLADRLAPRGLLSVLTRNQAGIAMRAGMSQQWDDVASGFDARYYSNRLGIVNVRADTPEEVIDACEHAGLSVRIGMGYVSLPSIGRTTKNRMIFRKSWRPRTRRVVESHIDGLPLSTMSSRNSDKFGRQHDRQTLSQVTVPDARSIDRYSPVSTRSLSRCIAVCTSAKLV